MTEHPYIALCRACFNRLTSTEEMWGQQVGEDPLAGWTHPYVQMYQISGMEPNRVQEQDAEYEMGFKVVADDMEQALNGAARLSALLNDQGEQDLPTAALYGGSDWDICTSTQGRAIHLIEKFANAQNIYHEGHVFTFVMGRS